MASLSTRALACLAVLTICAVSVLNGCGDSSSAATETSSPGDRDAISAGADKNNQNVLTERRKLLRQAVADLEDRDKVCQMMSDRFLKDNYGAPGDAGRKRCEKAVQGQTRKKGQHLESYRIANLGLKSARVRIVEVSGTVVIIDFVFQRGRWLIDHATSPSAAG